MTRVPSCSWATKSARAAAVTAALGTLDALMLAGPRLLFALAEQGQIPALLQRGSTNSLPPPFY